MSEGTPTAESEGVARHYLKTSRKVQNQLRKLLEYYHAQSKQSIDLEPQQFDFIWEGEGQPGEIEPGPFIDPVSKEEFERNERERELSRFNQEFLDLFEPIFEYQNCVLEHRKELRQEGKAKREAKDELKGKLGARRPLWLVVLEVEEKNLNYSIFATKDEEGTPGLKEPRDLFAAHRMYDNVDDERDLIDLSHLYAGDDISKVSYLPAIIAVLEDDDIGEDGEPGGACAKWKRRCKEGYKMGLNFIGLSRELVEAIDESLWRHLSGIDDINKDEIRKIIKEVRAELLEKWENWSTTLDGFVKFEGDEWFEGHEWYKEIWDRSDENRKGILLYFIWLRCLALAANRHSISGPDEAANFKAYLYFPVPDISGDYVHTVTAAFADWPDPEWILMVEQQAPKLFQRSGLLLAQRQAYTFGHEVYDTMEWVVRGLRRKAQLWNSIPVLLRQGLIAVRLSMRKITGFPYNSTAEFPGVSENPIYDYTKLSTMVALQRLGRIYDRGLRKKAKQLRRKKSPSAVIDFISLDVPPTPPEAEKTIRREAFGLMFYRCLWQAIYHSIKSRYRLGEQYAPPQIHVGCGMGKVTVEICNPGSDFESGRAGKSKDELEIKRLGDFLGAIDVYGPRYSMEKDLWETGFTFTRVDR
jgi:hypothetical protein